MDNSKNVMKLSSVDETKSLNAKLHARKKSLALASIDNYKPRDNLLYT
jgi:hypothetical protein